MVPKTESRSFALEVFCATSIRIDPNKQFTEIKREETNDPIEIELPSLLAEPSDANLLVEYELSPDSSFLLEIVDNMLLIEYPSLLEQRTRV
jgi:hypothetical protein